jgi:hypothetical protein
VTVASNAEKIKSENMSYSAFVVCNCFQNGKTEKPPHEEYVKFDEDGLYLDVPDEIWRKDEDKVYQMDSEFEKWKNNSCEHDEMELCYEHLSNNLGMSDFRQIVKILGGKQKYPILTEFLPTANGGILPAKFANNALQELVELEKEQHLEERVILIENSTNELKASVNADTYLIFVFTAYNKYNYGIDNDGFFILENIEEDGKEVSYVVFRSKNFRQRQISKEEFRFIDNKTNNSFFCSVGLHSNEENPKEVYEFSIKKEKAKIAEEYNYMIEPLKKLTKASVESGNPIHWT